MLRRSYFAVVFSIAAFLIASTASFAADAPAAAVNKLHGALLANMKDAAALEFEGRRAQLAPVVQDVFDIETMARVSTGAAWRNINEAERAGIVNAFADWTVANYASQFDGFDGERFEISSETDAGRGNVLVNTALVTKTETVALNYRLRRKAVSLSSLTICAH
jgi:phospholipid transport system substrate-binding protein